MNGKEDITIVLQFDKGHYKWGKNLIQSLAINAGEKKTLLYGINLTENMKRELTGIHSRLTIYNRTVPFISKKFKRHFMINRKPDVLLKAIKTHNSDFFLLLDADMLLINPIDPLLSACKDCTAGLTFEHADQGHHQKFNSSFVLVNTLHQGQHFVEKWLHTMKSSVLLKTVDEKLTIIDYIRNKKPSCKIHPVRIRKGSWFWDQVTLYYTVKNTPFICEKLPVNIYLNIQFDNHAILWSAHRGVKETTFEKYQNKIKQLIKKSPA